MDTTNNEMMNNPQLYVTMRMSLIDTTVLCGKLDAKERGVCDSTDVQKQTKLNPCCLMTSTETNFGGGGREQEGGFWGACILLYLDLGMSSLNAYEMYALLYIHHISK